MKKKCLCLLLAALMVASCFTGCGKKETASPETETNQESSEQVTDESAAEEELEEATIQIMLMGPGKQKDSEKVWAAFNEKLQEIVPNTTVEFTIVPSGEYKDTFNRMLAAGDPVDLAWVGFCSPKQNDLTADGSLMPLDDLLEKYGQGIKEELGDTIIEMSKYPGDGKLYYLISWQGLVTQKYALIVPTEFAELAGATWAEDTQKIVSDWYADSWDMEGLQKVFDQFDIYFKALQDNGKLYSGTTGMFNGGSTCAKGSGAPGTLHTDGVAVLRGDDTFTVVDTIQSDYYRLYAENSAEFWKKGYIRSDIASVEANSLVFLQKDEAGNLTPNATTLRFHNYLLESDPEKASNDYGMPLTFIGIEDAPFLGKGQETSMAIPYCADAPERAMMVLDAIYTDADLYNLLIYGIEGEHYTDNGDGTYTVADNYWTAEADYGLVNYYIGTCENAIVTQFDVPGYYTEMREAEKNAKIDPFRNFIFDKTNVTDIIAAIKAVDGEYEQTIITGCAGDNWEQVLDKWIAERKAAGVDKLIEEFQTQIQAYAKENNITEYVK